MRLPIQFALTAPDRLPSPARHAAPEEWGALEFEPLEADRYPAYRIVREAADAGGNRGTILNAADEVAVAAFLGGAIGYGSIAPTIEAAVARWETDVEPSLAEVEELDAEVRSALAVELGLGAGA
jgi:1-deoxy-D-xylulose-5-phosphate reductoisomerase